MFTDTFSSGIESDMVNIYNECVDGQSHTSPLDKLPTGLMQAVLSAGDRLVEKSNSLIGDSTTNITENYMSVRSKMDGGKFYNRIQSGSFQTRCMAAGLRLQIGTDWVSRLWLDNFGKPGMYQRLIGERRKRKLLLDCARKTTEKYRRQRMMNRLRLPISRPDNNYGSHPSEPDISDDELKRLCHEYIERLRVTQEEAKIISEKTADQSADVDHMWEAQRRGRITASNFGDACKRKTNMSGLTKRIIYGKNKCTAAMRYGNENENRAREDYLSNLRSTSPNAVVKKTGLHIPHQHPWLGASPDGLVTDPSSNNPEGLLEIKCPFRAKDTTLVELCTEKRHKSSNMFLKYQPSTKSFTLKRTHSYYFQVQGQMLVTGRSWCDFYVWTPRRDDRVRERIHLDRSFTDIIFKQLQKFYYTNMLPELAAPRHLRGQKIRENVDFIL